MWGLLLVSLLFSLSLKATEPPVSATNLFIGNSGSTVYTMSWDWSSSTVADKYLLIMKVGGFETSTPIDGQTYTKGQTFGGGEVFAILNGNGTTSDGQVLPTTLYTFNRTLLTNDGGDYWFTIYPYNTSGGTDYRITDPGQFAFVTPGIVEEPMVQASNFHSTTGDSNGSSRTITYSFENSPYELSTPFESRYLIVTKVGSPITYVPKDGAPDVTLTTKTLSDGSTGRLDNGPNYTLSVDISDADQDVYFKIFAYNKANSNNTLSAEVNGSYNYLTTSPLSAIVTIPAEPNQTPTISDATFTIDENTVVDTEVGQVSATDPDGDAINYSINSGNSSGAFAINNTSGSITVANSSQLDFETTPSFSLEIQATDGKGGTASATITINLNNLNDNTPSISNQAFDINENSVQGTQIGSVIATDADGDALTYAITSGNDNGTFAINSSTGLVAVANGDLLDYETNPSFAFTVQVSDPDNMQSSASITINLLDINDIPTMSDVTTSLNENSVVNTQAGQISASDPDGDAISYSIISGNDAGAFSINGTTGSVIVANSSPLDFESTDSFNIVIEANDGNGGIVNANMTINILNVNDIAPTITDAVFSLDEESPVNTVVGQMEGNDVEGDALTYSIVSGNDAGGFSIDTNTGNITVANSTPIDFETSPTFILSVQVSDGLFNTSSNATINLNDIEESSAPSINNQSFTIIESIENGANVGTIIATDAQGDNITFSIASGNTGNAFSLDNSSGLLTVNDRSMIEFTPNAKFELTINASDATESNAAVITIILNNAPVFDWASSTFSEDENKQWTIQIPITDAENDQLSFSFVSGNVDNLLAVVLNGASNVITTASVGGIDFEKNESFEIVLEATDALGNKMVSESITINISNLNDNIPETENQTLSINQNLANGTEITTVAGTDVDGDQLAFFLDSNGNIDDAFTIDLSTGLITVNNTNALDFSVNPTFNLVVSVTDGTLSSDANITINLNETAVNTSPSVGDQTFNLDENSSNGTSVGTISATDNEGDDLTFSIISGNTENAFLLSSSTGEILVTNSDALDFETNPVFTLTVSVSDGSLTEVATISIELNDLQETITAIDDRDVYEINVYPNPASNYFSITKNDLVDSIHIWNQEGQLITIIEKQQDNQYRIDKLKKGIYYLRISSKNNFHNNRIVIK